MNIQFHGTIPLLFHSNIQSWQMHSLPTLDPYDPYVFLLFHLVLGYSIILEVNYKEAALRLGFGQYGAY